MISLSGLFSHVFRFFHRRKILLYALILAVAGSSLFVLRNITVSEDIQPLIPHGATDAAVDFRYLQQAPFIDKVAINVRAEPGSDAKVLVRAVDRLAGALTGPYFDRVVTGPEMPPAQELISWLLRVAPGLMTESDTKRVRTTLTPEGVSLSLQEIQTRLNSPEGWAMRSLFQKDPLQLHLIMVEKFRFMNIFKGMKLRDNHFMSADGRNALIIAETPVRFTNSKGARDLAQHTREVIESHGTPGTTVSVLSSHAYTVANAETIKRDLFAILTCSSLSILVLLFIFIQNWRAIFVFLVPMTVVSVATAGVLLVYEAISAVTIAFGSVLMGISDDYPIFTYFSLRNRRDCLGSAVGDISHPILSSGVTTMATFGALFFSDLPGQRQIGLFSITGIVASLGFSLIVLPHFIRKMPCGESPRPFSAPKQGTLFRGFVITGWLLVMGFCLWQGGGLKFNGDMRAVSMVPQAIKNTETEFKGIWGDFRGTAMVFAEGRDLQSALENNDRLFAYLKDRIHGEQIVSLAPLLPSAATQEANRRRWKALWSGEGESRVRRLLVEEGEKLGFLPHAFNPFLEGLSSGPTTVTVDDLRGLGLRDIADSLIVQEKDKVKILTLVPDTPEVASLFASPANTPFVGRFVSQRRFNDTISDAMVRNFVTYIVSASTVIVLFLVILFRHAGKVACAVIPTATGLVFMFGIMGWKGIEFNLFNIIATILVIGLSVDLGIFMVSRGSQGYDGNTKRAVLLSGLTSLVGMGALILAHHPALYSIGVTVLIGMCGSIPSALLVIPALYSPRKA